MMLPIVVFFLFCSVLFMGLAAFTAIQREKVQQRLNMVKQNAYLQHTTTHQVLKVGQAERREKLNQAGFYHPQAERYFLCGRFAFMAALAVGWAAYQPHSLSVEALAQAMVMALVGGIMMDRWLDWKVQQTRMEISRIVPDAIDLMVVCVSSGLTLEAVFRCVGEEMQPISPALSREWLITATELSVLDSPEQALVNLDKRLALLDVNNMVVTMNQAMKFGTPMAHALSLIATDSRQYLYLALEEWVGKIPAKMSLPLVCLIMMPVVVIIVAPIILTLLAQLEQI